MKIRALIIATLTFAALSQAAYLECVVRESGVQGGLIVCTDWVDADELASARLDSRYIVQGLSRDPAVVRTTRRALRNGGLLGPVSVVHWQSEQLPYAEQLVNLFISRDARSAPPDAEVQRVMTPRGIALLGDRNLVQPVPEEIDDWTHFLHSPNNNAVAADSIVGPPRHMQWVAGPRWSRSHDHLASFSAAVSADGRVFYIVDEGPVASVKSPPSWVLVARDAFNGTLLWKKPIGAWEDTLRPFRSGPTELPRRLVAIGSRVYVTLGYGAPVTALEATSGEVVHTYAETANTHEILCAGDSLYVVMADVPTKPGGTSGEHLRDLPPWTGRGVYRQYAMAYTPKTIRRVTLDDGTVVWTRRDKSTRHLMPMTLSVHDERVFFQNETHVVALSAADGTPQWKADRPMSRLRPAFSSPTLVVGDRVVISADRGSEAKTNTGNRNAATPEWLVSPTMISTRGDIVAFAADTGKRLWTAPCHEAFNAPVDIFVVGDKVWSGFTSGSKQPGITKVYDLLTGKIVDTRPPDQDAITIGFVHGRCHRNKATEKYIIHGRAGAEFVDTTSHDVTADHWVRGACQYGFLTCNGLLYAPPHSCACYNEAKLNNLNALAPHRPGATLNEATDPLLKGPAYGTIPAAEATADGWTTYRGDAARSGTSETSVSATPEPAWSCQIGGRLTAPVAAAGRIFVAERDGHTVHALHADDGTALWQFEAGGRVDSPPTLHGGCIYFGSADGHVYCVTAADGRLVWRFRAAPAARQIVAYGQPASAWPVHGSVLVQPIDGSDGDAIVYAVAGRSSYVDGGLRLHGLDASTGKSVFCRTISHRDPTTGLERQDTITGKRGTYMPGALPDILSSDGVSIFMRHLRFDARGNRQPCNVDHLFSSEGFLDDDWWHRTYWMIGSEMRPDYHGWPYAGRVRITGRLLVTTPDTVYGFGRETYEKAGSHLALNTGYHLFAAARKLGPEKPPARDPGNWLRSYPGSRVQRHWSAKLPFLTRAMALAGNTLFVAGPVQASDFKSARPEGETWLWAVSTGDGKRLSAQRLDAPPVFDAMAICDGQLILSTTDGCVRCLR